MKTCQVFAAYDRDVTAEHNWAYCPVCGFVWLPTLGREPALREKILSFANLKPGETVLDVGCGTGSLAIAAKRHVGSTGTVHGIDASPDMLARQRRRARPTLR